MFAGMKCVTNINLMTSLVLIRTAHKSVVFY